MKNKKIVFMGTPEFAIPILESLINNYDVIGVVCQPDKEVGRKHVLTICPVKQLAINNNIKIFQPTRLKNDYQSIIDLKPDMIVTCAYGQILPFELLNYPQYKTINVHGSILPKLRGGAPIERAIMNGYEETGITIMKTDKGMDSGDIITAKSIIIDHKDTYKSLSGKLSILGAELLIETLPSIFNKTCKYIKQNDKEVTFAPIIKSVDEHLDFNDTSINIYNKIRALYPNPACYVVIDSKRVKIYEAEMGNNRCGDNGEIIEIYPNGIGISCKDSEIIIKKLQVEGKNIMDAKEYLNGKDKDELLGKILK